MQIIEDRLYELMKKINRYKDEGYHQENYNYSLVSSIDSFRKNYAILLTISPKSFMHPDLEKFVAKEGL